MLGRWKSQAKMLVGTISQFLFEIFKTTKPKCKDKLDIPGA
jgi:hypothetical protein